MTFILEIYGKFWGNAEALVLKNVSMNNSISNEIGIILIECANCNARWPGDKGHTHSLAPGHKRAAGRNQSRFRMGSAIKLGGNRSGVAQNSIGRVLEENINIKLTLNTTRKQLNFLNSIVGLKIPQT